MLSKNEKEMIEDLKIRLEAVRLQAKESVEIELRESNKLLRSLVLHLTSKPIKRTHTKEGVTYEESWEHCWIPGE